MAYTYDPLDLVLTTSSGRLNVVRLLVGDTNSDDPQVQNEEIDFSLNQSGNNVYSAAVYVCRLIASKYARMVDTQLDGALEATYSDRVKHYNLLAAQIGELGKRASGRALGVSAGGIKLSAIDAANKDTDRNPSAFEVGKFDNPGAGIQYIKDYD
jgi:hypothetical protein